MRKVYMCPETDEEWSCVMDAVARVPVDCWRFSTGNDGENETSCHRGCAAFQEWEGRVACLALPSRTIFGELVPVPAGEEGA